MCLTGERQSGTALSDPGLGTVKVKFSLPFRTCVGPEDWFSFLIMVLPFAKQGFGRL